MVGEGLGWGLVWNELLMVGSDVGRYGLVVLDVKFFYFFIFYGWFWQITNGTVWCCRRATAARARSTAGSWW